MKNHKLYPYYVLMMMMGLYMVNVADRYVASGLLQAIKQSFDVSDQFMGFLVGPAFAVCYTLLAIPIASFADRHNRVRIIISGAVIWSAFTVLSGLAQTPWYFALARLGVGIGEAAFLAPAFSLLADYFPPRRRALAFALLNFGVYFGQVFGLVGGAYIASLAHWRWAFIWLGAPGLVLALLTLLSVAEPNRGRLDGQTSGSELSPSFRATVMGLWRHKGFRFMTLGTAAGGFASYGFGIWAPTLFARAFDLSLSEANTRYGAPAFLAGLSGAIILGFICDRLAAKDGRWPFRLAAIGLGGFGLFMIGACLTRSVILATWLVYPAGLLAGGWVIAMQSALQDLIPASIRATGTALWAFALTFTGLALGVWFAGWAIDQLTPYYGVDAIRPALAFILLFNLPAIGLLWMAGRYIDVPVVIASKTHHRDEL